jgi:hypothetical protein
MLPDMWLAAFFCVPRAQVLVQGSFHSLLFVVVYWMATSSLWNVSVEDDLEVVCTKALSCIDIDVRPDLIGSFLRKLDKHQGIYSVLQLRLIAVDVFVGKLTECVEFNLSDVWLGTLLIRHVNAMYPIRHALTSALVVPCEDDNDLQPRSRSPRRTDRSHALADIVENASHVVLDVEVSRTIVEDTGYHGPLSPVLSYPPLIEAVVAGNLANIRQLLAYGELVDQTYRGWTPFMMAAERDCVPIMQALFEYHADINAQNATGRTALSFASAPSKVLDPVTGRNGVRPAALRALAWLLANGVNVAMKDNKGHTALGHAIRERRQDAVAAITRHDLPPRAAAEEFRRRVPPWASIA